MFYLFNPFLNKPLFLHACRTSLLKTQWEKEKLLVMSNSSFSQCFLPVWRTFWYCHQILNCCLQTLSLWKSLNFFVWKRLKPLPGYKILAMSKLKASADNNLSVTPMVQFFFDKVENIVEKGKKMLETYLLFPYNVFKRLLSEDPLNLYHKVTTFKDPV